jgi:hypothetical protein
MKISGRIVATKLATEENLPWARRLKTLERVKGAHASKKQALIRLAYLLAMDWAL